MIITEKVIVRPNGKMIQYYKNLGYDAKYLQNLEVNVNDLPKQSEAEVLVKCDICGNVKTVKYCNYILAMNNYNFYCCSPKCAGHKTHLTYLEKNQEEIDIITAKRRKTNLNKYGTDNVMKVDFIKEKSKQTIIEKYGVENSSQSQEIKDKIKNTLLEKYGVPYTFQSDIIRKKGRKTCLERYGVEVASQNSEIYSKMQKSLYEKYGVIYPLQSKELKEKASNTLYNHSTQKTSKQQLFIYLLFKKVYSQTKLNYPIKNYSGDIILDNLDIEIDYGGHILSIILGDITQEEFNQKELIRDKIIKSEGYKVVRIKSYNSPKVPTEEKLLEILSYTQNFFKENPTRSWITFDIDNSCIYNAYHKDGIPFDFGKLKYIK